MENPFRTEQNIFNGKFKLITIDNEFRMSHWVKGFGIADTSGGEMILEQLDAFNLDKFEEKGDHLNITFQVYPNGRQTHEAVINPFEKTFTYNNKTLPLKDFRHTFDQ